LFGWAYYFKFYKFSKSRKGANKICFQKIGEQIKQRIAERIVLAVVTRRKNFYQAIGQIIKIIFNSFKTVFLKIKSNYQKGKGKNQGAKSKKYIKIIGIYTLIFSGIKKLNYLL